MKEEYIMFYKEVNTTSKEEMVNFLRNHFRYYTMNSWNGLTSYANNVKLHNLGLTYRQLEKAYDMLISYESEDIDTSLYTQRIHDVKETFNQETGYQMDFNGRSGGYLVLYDTNEKGETLVRSIDDSEDFEDWEIEDLQERVKLVSALDKCCDEMRNVLLDILENYDLVSYEYEKTVVVTAKKLKPISKEKK